MIDAAEARRIGLVNGSSRPTGSWPSRGAAPSHPGERPAGGPGLPRRGRRRAGDDGSIEALQLEASYFGLLSGTEDMQEGTEAFLEKRRPSFKGV